MAGATIGLHIAFSGHIGDTLGVMRRCYDAGQKVPCALVCSDPGLAETLRPYVGVMVYRFVASGNDPSPFDENGHGDGKAWTDEMHRRNSQAPSATWRQDYNEVSFHGNVQPVSYAENVARVELEMMRRADEIGTKITIGNYLPGVPDPAKYGDALAPVYDYAAAHGHAALMHWYSNPNDDGSMLNDAENMVHRLLRYWARWPNMPVIIGEMALYHAPRFRGIESQLRVWRDCADVIRPYRAAGRKIYVMSWTIRASFDQKWSGDDFTDHLDVYEAELKAGRLR